jgi:hypothetical protein
MEITPAEATAMDELSKAIEQLEDRHAAECVAFDQADCIAVLVRPTLATIQGLDDTYEAAEFMLSGVEIDGWHQIAVRY